jgi:hypothetical protein
MKHFRVLRAGIAAFFTFVMIVCCGGSASAAPTAEFTYRPTSPVVGRLVTFTFTGHCDIAPCRIQWRCFKAGGSSRGTAIGEGHKVTHRFTVAGTYFVVAKITNAGSTHGSATATHAVVVRSKIAALTGARQVLEVVSSG